MIDVPKLVAKLGAMGHTPSEIAEVLQECMGVPACGMEAATKNDAALREAARKRKNAERMAAYRKAKRDAEQCDYVAATPEGSVARTVAPRNATPSREGGRVVLDSSSSLRSEEVMNPPSFPPNDFVLEPEEPKPKAKRGTRLPQDWWLNDRNREDARKAGLSPERTEYVAREFRNYWHSRSRDATRIDWDLVWQNRANEIGSRDREKLARQADSRSGGRGVVGLGEYLAGQRSSG